MLTVNITIATDDQNPLTPLEQDILARLGDKTTGTVVPGQVEVEDRQTDQNEPEQKPKRKRRTKAEMEADRLAEEQAAKEQAAKEDAERAAAGDPDDEQEDDEQGETPEPETEEDDTDDEPEAETEESALEQAVALGHRAVAEGKVSELKAALNAAGAAKVSQLKTEKAARAFLEAYAEATA